MADKIEKASSFKNIAGVLALSLIAAAALVYVQAGNREAASPSRPVFAALSQAIPLHAEQALQGDGQAFAQLEGDMSRLSAAVSGASTFGLPGGAGPWAAMQEHGNAILERRVNIQTIGEATAFVDEHIPLMLSASDRLLDVSGSTGIIQEFQQRATSMRDGLSSLSAQSDPVAAASSLAGDLAFLRLVTNALSGAATDLDVTALGDADRETALLPVIGELSDIESRINQVVEAAPSLVGTSEHLAALYATAAELLASEFSDAGATGGGVLDLPWLPLGLLAFGLALLVILIAIHGKAAIFERTSMEQSEQNERNQQAILRLLDELGSLADGDLTVEATVTEDITGAIADSINYAIEKLRELVATINETAIMVDSAAKQTASTATHMARAADNQTNEINAATESIVSMAGSIEEVSGNAERSSDVARHSVEVAHKGGEAVRRTIDGMNAIRETIQETSKRIKRLGESSQEIGNIIELINDIAEQTNILALNASIQASMAGEAGRGFAVVADEVQRLAERSTNATKQIEVLVRTIQADTNEAVVSMERSTTDVVGGALLAENAGAALDEIEQVSNQIANLVQNISGSARQQAGSAADVTRRTTKLKEIAGQTGKATTATAASISKLSELASQLRQTVAGFTLPSAALKTSALVGSAAPPPAVAAPPPRSNAGSQAAG